MVDLTIFIAGMGGLMILNTVLGFYIIKLRHKITALEDALDDKENS